LELIFTGDNRQESEKPAFVKAFAEIVIEVQMEIEFDHCPLINYGVKISIFVHTIHCIPEVFFQNPSG